MIGKTRFEKQDKKKTLPFPKLMEHQDGDFVVLMWEAGMGVVVDGGVGYEIGTISNNWLLREFVDLDSDQVVELRND